MELLGDIPPNHTVYANNLDDQVKKQDLRMHLYCLFSQYGVILDVVALKTQKMRGQAFVTFRDVGSATQALQSLQGFSFFGKPMRLQYAKSKANVIAQIEGTFDPRSRPKRKVEFGLSAGAGGSKKTVGIAFIEFGDEGKAAVAMKALQAFKITPTHMMKISYAKA